MAQQLPIKLQEIVNLTAVGIQPQSCTFANVTIQSEKFICVRETIQDQGSIAIIDMANPKQPSRQKISADAAIMNPATKVLALRAGNNVQIFNIEMKSKMKATTMSEPIIFWRWVNGSTLALCTSAAMYHWSMEGESAPQKVFDRHDSLSDCQIISYKTDDAMKWLCLVGIKSTADNRIGGQMQLFSVDKKVSQPIEGHAAEFTQFNYEGKEITLFSFCSKGPENFAKLHIIEVGGQSGFQKRVTELPFQQEVSADFPVGMITSSKYGVAYVVTKFGFLHLCDLESGSLLYVNRVSGEFVFTTCSRPSVGGFIAINRKGQVLSVTVDENNLVPYVSGKLNNVPLAMRIAGRSGLPGADDLFQKQFDLLLGRGQVREAAQLAAGSAVLRTQQTLQRFRQCPAPQGQPNPVLLYLGLLLEKTKLNKVESVELTRIVIQQGKGNLLQNWIKEDKVECSEEMGDIIRQYDANTALSVYLKADAKNKVIQCFLDLGAVDKILIYTQRVGFKPDWHSLLQNVVARNPQAAKDFAIKLAQNEEGPLVDFNTVVDIFTGRNLIQEATAFLVEVLKPDREEDAALQTKCLEINLISAPHVAEAIFSNDMFSHYDRNAIAVLCEKAGLFQRALQHYTDIEDIKRVVTNTHSLSPDFLAEYFSNLSAEWALECLKQMLSDNLRQNLQLVVQLATRYSEQLTPEALIEMFESFNSYEGLFFYLGGIVNFSEDPDVHYKYIEAATKIGQFKEVERVTRESNYYDGEKVKNFLKEAKLADPRPFINVCDKHDFIGEMTHFLYANNMFKYIEVYVQKVNPSKTPQVVGALLDKDANEEEIKQLIVSVRSLCPIEGLVEEVEKRNRLKVLLPWLESRKQEGSTDTALFNALGKIYVDTNNNPERFLTENPHYDSRVVGKYCEKRDPYLAFVAYKRGQCDQELVEVTSKNHLYKHLARYLVDRQDPDLWASVLKEENEHKRELIDQVVSTGLPETKSPDSVSVTVRAFMTADLPNELIELLEKIVLSSTSEFKENKNLQNLLILTAIKADKTRVRDYISRLDNFDGPDIANIAVSSELYEEAFIIFKKFQENVSAISVLLDNLEDFDRAKEFALKCDAPEVYSKLAHSQLEKRMVAASIESYLKANDPSHYKEVIRVSDEEGAFKDLIKFLLMARKKVKESVIDTELIFAYARTNKLGELEDFINGPNVAQVQQTADRCFEMEMYEAAKILYNNISNYPRLAVTLLKLEQFQEAVDAARKANNTRTWKEVNEACVDAGKFRLAQMAGLHIIVNTDEIDELIRVYEVRGYFEELLALFENGIGLDLGGGQNTIFTALGVLYSKYKPEKLMEHIKLFHSRLNIPKLLRECDNNEQWAELAYLYEKYDEFDNAAMTMIRHSAAAWSHTSFKDVITKVSNIEIYYRAINFYLEEEPMLLNELLLTLASRLDHAKVVNMLRGGPHLIALAKPYLTKVQENNVAAVNEVLNQFYIDEEDAEKLRKSVDTFDAFDQIGLAQQLENHDLLEFRRIAAHLYKKNERWAQAVELAKKDNLHQDAMETAAQSKDAETVESLLQFFVENGLKECFAACLFTCYDFIKPDLVLELAWRNGLMDYAMPYLVQMLKEYTGKVDKLVEGPKEEATKPQTQQQEIYGAPVGMLPAPNQYGQAGYDLQGYGGQVGYGGQGGYGGQAGYGGQPGYGF